MNNTVEFWAEYFRTNPDHALSYTRVADGVEVSRYLDAGRHGPRLALFGSMLEAANVITAARALHGLA